MSLSRIVLADVDALAELDAEAELASESSAAEDSFVAPVGPEGIEGAGADAPRAAPYLTLFELSRALLRPRLLSQEARSNTSVPAINPATQARSCASISTNLVCGR